MRIAEGAALAQRSVSDSRGEAPISTEFELKFDAEPSELADLRRVLSTRMPGSQTSSHRLVSTYFDTPDCALRRAGTILRVREERGRFVQTVKAADLGGNLPFSRGEWEDVVAGNKPDLHAGDSGLHVPPELSDELRPVFVTEVERAVVEIEPKPGTRIEAAFDQGTIRTVDGVPRGPINEVELELKAGDASLLYEVAIGLLEAAPLRMDLPTKAERGYRLVAGITEPPAVSSPEPILLTPEMTVEDALQRVGRACLAHFLQSEPAALAGRIEGVHQMRIGMRQLRSMLSAVEKMLSETERRRVADEIATLANGLGAARNLDVFATELLPPARKQAPDQPGWEALSAAAERARADAHRRVCDEIRSPQHTASVLRLLRWFEGCGWRQAPDDEPDPALRAPIGALAPAILDRRRKTLRRRSRHFRRLPAHQRHRLRIAVKKLRYTIELLSSLYKVPDARSFIKRLKRVQDALGHANDVRVAYGIVIELGRSATDVEPIIDAGAQLLAYHQQELTRRDDQLRGQLRRLNKAPPFWHA